MLVTLGTNIALGAGSTSTTTYSPNSVQKVFIRLEDSTGSNAYEPQITVQIGSQVICNGASALGLVGLTQLQSGVAQSAANSYLELDFGSWECMSRDNLYVSVYSASAIDAVDVSALVDEPGLGVPFAVTEYSDNTFTSNNNRMAISYKSTDAEVDEDAYNCEIRTSINSSSPSFISANSFYKSMIIGADRSTHYGLLNTNQVPLNTSYNYSGSAATNRILTVEQRGISRGQAQAGRQSAVIARTMAGR